MQKKKAKTCAVAVLMTVLMLLIQSCATTKPVYIQDVPYISFPAFPVPTETTFDSATGTVIVPIDWYIQLAEYKTEIKAIERFYKFLSEHEEAQK